MAETVRPYDLIAIQEVVAGYGGQAVARLADELNRTGQKWDYSFIEVPQAALHTKMGAMHLFGRQRKLPR
ncbi:hypothetical protein IM793_22875 [Pedobacter sp. MR2016-19]|uniref:hypothetical protein n=1 Tax=Pedobacter sp. MR2016-19 TaxID=2780089 RepID=UPI001873A54D|nr:hypothetical protein [Pedobacter sp. MR2016-19]MBE5322017.1 hypothetical protein [Pedobacter sp. MR2016-19]